MATIQQLEQALIRADQAGDTTAARALAADLKRLMGAQQQAPQPIPGADPTEGMTRLDRVLVGAGRGLTDLGQGTKQLALNAGAKLGVVDQSRADAYNADVREEAALFDKHLGDDGWAWTGRMGAQVAATLPASGIGMAARGATALRTAGKVGAYGAATGAGVAALNPVTDVRAPTTMSDLINGQRQEGSDFWDSKFKQTAVGAAAGGILSAGGKLVGNALQGTVNAPRKAVNALVAPQPITPTGPVTRTAQVFTGTPAGIRRGDRIVDSTGINLTPGQRSGGKAMTMMENVARGSVWTRDKMFAGDQARARQMLNTIRSTARDMSPTKTSPEAFAIALQDNVKTSVKSLAEARSAFGRKAYGAVEEAAGGAPIVQTRATLDTIASVVDEFKGVQGADAAAIARQADAFFNSLSGDGAISAGKALRQLQAWEQAARTGTGIFEGVQDRTTAKMIAGKLARALHDDLDATADMAGGSIGEALRAANKGWRDYSRQIDTMEASALGRLVGEDFADDVAGVAFNRVSPEKVWSRLDGLSATELESVKQYMQRSSPDLWQQYQRLTLERARDAARASAPSMGSRTLGINPGAFVRSLEGGSGQKAVDAQKRLKVIFDDHRRLNDLLEAGRRMADSTGTNFSGTAGASEIMQMPGLLGKVAEGAKATIGAFGPLVGTQQVARLANTPISGRQPMPMYQMGRAGQFLFQAPSIPAANQLPPWLLQPPAPAERRR